MLNISEQITVDERCANWSRQAFYCATELQSATAGANTLYGMRIRIPALADRIIALRTQQAAQG